MRIARLWRVLPSCLREPGKLTGRCTHFLWLCLLHVHRFSGHSHPTEANGLPSVFFLLGCSSCLMFAGHYCYLLDFMKNQWFKWTGHHQLSFQIEIFNESSSWTVTEIVHYQVMVNEQLLIARLSTFRNTLSQAHQTFTFWIQVWNHCCQADFSISRL